MDLWKRLGTPLAAVALALTLGACDGNGPVDTCDPPRVGSPPNCQCPSGTRPDGATCVADCTTTNVLQESSETPSSTLLYEDFSVPDSGRLDVTLDWTIPSSLVGFYIVPANTCTLAEFNARTCNFVVRSEPVTTKPRKISTPNFAAGNYRWLVANYASQQESVSLQIVLQKGTGCAPLAGGAPAAAARGESALPDVERMTRR
jgi:hypothetical protein